MSERDPDYPRTHFIEKLHLVSNFNSTVTVPMVAVTPGEDTTTDCSNALKVQACCFACHPSKHEHMHKLQQVELAHEFTTCQLLLP